MMGTGVMERDTVSILRRFSACDEAVEWVQSELIRYPDLSAEDLWNSCPRGDWLLWISGKARIERTKLVYAACQTARLALQFVPAGDGRPLKAIETAEAWTRGEEEIGAVRAVADAAYAAYAADAVTYAAYAADAAAYAADAAADAADAAAYAAYAADAAAYAADAAADAAAYAADAAAYAVAYAAYAAYAADAVTYAAYAKKEMQQKCADTVRRHITFAEVMEAIERRG